MSTAIVTVEPTSLVAELGGSDAIRAILDVVCQTTGMGFAAVAHVTETRWVACQVRDDIAFGLGPGGELPVKSTLCDTVRGTRNSIVIDEVAKDPVYRSHHTPAIYGLQSYIAVPIVLQDGQIFGTLCAIDPLPHAVDTPAIRGMFMLFAQLIGTQVDRFRAAEENKTLSQRVADALADRKVFADIVESSTAAVTALDLDWRILAINRANVEAFERAFGKRPAVGERFLDLFDGVPQLVEQQREIWSRALRGESFVIVQEFGDVQHERRHFEVRFSPLLNSEGERIGASSTSYDVTDRVVAETQLAAAQEQLRHAQKLEAMGQLTGGVAHDFNNLLAPIVGALDVLRRREVIGERERRLIAGATQAADRAKTLVQRLLAFARRQPLQATAVDVAALVAGLAELIASTTGPQIKVVLDLDEDLPPAHADANQIEMALLNLAVNARDAMPSGGELRIAAAAASWGDNARPEGLSSGLHVRLSVTDTGVGMDQQTLARAVEPFFSTKGIGKGTGLGLSMVEGLARQLGGAFTLESQPGLGTRVALWLPVSETPSLGAKVLQPEPSGETATGLVLLVEDEALVRMSAADMLNELGYRVIEASSAEEALAQVRSGARPDLVVTDHLMPGMTGADLARIFAQEYPAIPTLIVSGYAQTEGIAPEVSRLAKPFLIDDLSRALSEVSRSKGGSLSADAERLERSRLANT